MKDENLAFTRCTIIDGHLDHDIIQDGTVMVKNSSDEESISGIIEQVGSSTEIDIPSGYRTISLKDRYVLPGLINSHAHLPFCN